MNGFVTIEFQSVLNTNYEISNGLHISDVVSLTRDLVTDLNSVLIHGQLSDFSERTSKQDEDNSCSSELLATGTFFSRPSISMHESNIPTQRRRRSPSIIEEFRLIMQDLSRTTKTIILVNEEENSVKLTTEDAQRILETMQIWTERFLPIHGRIENVSYANSEPIPHQVNMSCAKIPLSLYETSGCPIFPTSQ